MAYYLYQTFDRPNDFSTILRAQCLVQQFLVDTYSIVDGETPLYLLCSQNMLKAALHEAKRVLWRYRTVSGWRRILEGKKTVFLPKTFIGVDTYMRHKMFDIIAVLNSLSHCHILFAVTCSPKWKEITEEFLHRQTAPDRPSIRARVFST